MLRRMSVSSSAPARAVPPRLLADRLRPTVSPGTSCYR